jgi:hypothetical protein
MPPKKACGCGWKGNKTRKLRFKRVTKEVCPDCGVGGVRENEEYTFWRGENKGELVFECGVRSVCWVEVKPHEMRAHLPASFELSYRVERIGDENSREFRIAQC